MIARGAQPSRRAPRQPESFAIAKLRTTPNFPTFLEKRAIRIFWNFEKKKNNKNSALSNCTFSNSALYAYWRWCTAMCSEMFWTPSKTCLVAANFFFLHTPAYIANCCHFFGSSTVLAEFFSHSLSSISPASDLPFSLPLSLNFRIDLSLRTVFFSSALPANIESTPIQCSVCAIAAIRLEQ